MEIDLIDIFIGFDSALEQDFHVTVKSLMRNSTSQLSITPIMTEKLDKSVYWRDIDPKASNTFSYSRFLVPYFSGYSGWSIFMDSDVVVEGDITDLWNLRDDNFSAMCIHHDYTPKSKVKFRGNVQYEYPRKNWSSVILFNNQYCSHLSPNYVNNATPAELHRFQWLDKTVSEFSLGELPVKWNFLVGEYEKDSIEDIGLYHYTLGTPFHKEYRDCDYAEIWGKYI